MFYLLAVVLLTPSTIRQLRREFGKCHGVSWGGFVNIAISVMVYNVLLFWRPPVACYGEAAIVKTARHVFAWTLN